MSRPLEIKAVDEAGFPMRGIFTLAGWARMLDYKPETLLAGIQKHGIRTLTLKGECFINAEWFWSDVLRISPALKG